MSTKKDAIAPRLKFRFRKRPGSRIGYEILFSLRKKAVKQAIETAKDKTIGDDVHPFSWPIFMAYSNVINAKSIRTAPAVSNL